MAWRFKASKFKNAAPIVPKPEACVRDICVGSYQTYGNNIAASAAFMAFNVDHNGSSLGVLPIDDCGRKSKSMPLLHAHSDTVTDMDFSNFHDGLLATGSQDCMVKIWHIPEKGLEESLCNPEITFSHRQRRVECVKWHPTVDCLLTTASYATLTLWDVTNERELYSMNGDYGLVQSISWKSDGTNLAFHTKEKTVCILDPRADKITYSADSHQSIKDSRVVWLGDTNRILTTGFDSARQREVYIRDIRNFKTPEKTLVLDSSTGILIPLFDPDTSMLFLAGKGDTTINYLEVTEREPYLVEGIRHTGEQTKGACLVPKRALNVMQAEVNRLLQLTSSSIIPIMYQVPRKSYRDFHSELFPSTAGCESKVNPTQWMQGSDLPVPKISLNPADKQVKPRLGPKPFTPPKFESGDSVERNIILDNDPPATNAANIMTTSLPDFINSNSNSVNGNEKTSPESQPDQENNDEEDGVVESSPTEEEEDVGGGGDEIIRGGVRASIAERRKMYEARSQSVQEPAAVSPVPLRRRDSLKAIKNNAIKEEDNVNQKTNQAKSTPAPPTSTAPKRTSTVFGRVSKYRHLKGTPAHKSQHIENVRNVSRQISGECDGFHCNKDRVGVPLGGPGGKLAVFELSKPGKLPDGVIPTLVNATNIMDFSWDPFDNKRLAVGCDDGSVKLWVVPESGLAEATNNADIVLQAHIEKIYCLKFHPLASDILATTSYDMTIRIWDLSTLQQAYCLKTEDHVIALAWSPCGRRIAAATRGSSLLIFEPREGNSPIAQGKGPGGTRGARIVWALDGQYLAVMGFDKVSERQIMLFKSSDLSNPLTSIGLDVSPAILIPFYDEDSSTLFLTGRGDSTIYAFEVSSEAPYLNPLSHHRCGSLHQGLSFLPKNCVDVTQVEFAKALRLTNTTIEPLSFTVPRIKSDLFQDDLFPDTKVTWEPTMTSTEWLSGMNKQQLRISLKPPDMDCLSEAQGAPVSQPSNVNPIKEIPNKPPAHLPRNSWTDSSIKQKQEQIQKSVSSRVEINMKLEQDNMEGVDAVEWNE
ncbi:coronin-7 isoform X2 [Halyomorpha halys]|uniref:coronin-7 isoform X2 n=1 Tax=Halyomorpha halys TaxID=286706 RepID=UPI0006D4E5FF|nr:coronin-7 isoform X2 [Halyomorpha halys]